VRSLLWTIRSVGIQIDRINEIWASKLGITGPQFLILAALADANEENGTRVNRLAKALDVDPSFVTTQTKILEKSGLLIRKPSAEDARVVLIRPSERLRKMWNELSLRRIKLHNTVFSRLGGTNVDQVRMKLSELEAVIQIAATLTELNADGEFSGK
jgi:DNA-binding MarR family transcriptional regulator